MATKFTHLHLHTQFSLLDGFAKIEQMLDRVKDLGMDSVAITDHGNMFGAVEFYKQAKKRGIKPIIGCEVYVTPGDYTSKTVRDKTRHHLILLAKNQTGYQNLIKIVSEGYVNGYYYKPRVDMSILEKYSEGLVCLSACLGGEIPRLIRDGKYKEAKEKALKYQEIFGQGNYYLELQDHDILEQKRVNIELNKIHMETGIPLVATNDVHFTSKEDFKVHDVLLCVQTGATINQEKRMRFPNNEFYVKSPEEMDMVLGQYEGALANTQVIADMCNFDFEFGQLHLPHFDIPEGYTNFTYLRELVYKGLERKYDNISQEIRERADFELKTMGDMGFIDYFLIVWDFIDFARKNDIPVGPGRGSAAGSIVSYALDITDIDPLKYSLLFERFLNPERVSMPDIDIDFCYERRDEVIDYVKRKYGSEKVAQIVTFGTMAARNSLRDVARAMEIDYQKVDKIAKQVPTTIGMTIDKALEVSNDFKESYQADQVNKELIDTAKAVEGMPRHTSTHAAGVVIASRAVDEFVPLSRNGDQITTQYNMIELEELGLLKMDFLGLRTLTVIKDACDLIKINHGIEVDLKDIDENDPKVMDLFNKANTIGIFQFESEGMRAFLKELKPDRFDDLVAANSLFRPGPMNEIPTYIQNRHKPEKVTYLHESLEDILDVTYGTIVFQEQVMEIVQKLAGFSLGEADNLRRAMGKKKMATMEEYRNYFVFGRNHPDGSIDIKGCIRNGVPEDIANRIYDLMIDFAKYAFNKSHSAAYAMVAIETAWLKTYYPTEFMAALLSSVMSDTSKIQLYIKEAKRLGIEVLPPSVNKSYGKFSVEGSSIRMGLSAIKTVGKNFIASLVKERKNGEYINLKELIDRMAKLDNSGLNKTAVEAMILSGAFDEFNLNRSQMIPIYTSLMESATRSVKKNIAGQTNMFAFDSQVAEEAIVAPDFQEYPKRQLLNYEKEYLGIYVSDNPFSPYEKIVEDHVDYTTLDFVEMQKYLEDLDNKKGSIAGIVTKKREHITKNNQVMAFITIEDLYGESEVIVFGDAYKRHRDIIEENSPLLCYGTFQVSEVEDGPKMILDDCMQISESMDLNSWNKKKSYSLNRKNSQSKTLYIQSQYNDKEKYSKIRSILLKYKGDSKVVIYFNDIKKAMNLNKELYVNLENKSLLNELYTILGHDNVKVQI